MLRSYQERMLPKRDSDAEFIDDDIYASDDDRATEGEPRGLLDRLYKERLRNQPLEWAGNAQAVPTTKNRFS